jgi:regulatory protein
VDCSGFSNLIFAFMYRPTLNKELALKKAKYYCAYQERCHSEVKEKLYSLGLYKNAVEELVATLVEGNYLNEERFAIQFAGGRFRMKQWGKVKIKYELKKKQVSDYCIKKALAAIETDDYEKTLRKLFTQKKQSLKSEKNIFIKKRKINDYLMTKGFEADRINELLKTWQAN